MAASESADGRGDAPAVAVLNGCGHDGYARRAASQLRAAGLSVIEVANAPSQSYATTLVVGGEMSESAPVVGRIIAVLGCGKAGDGEHGRPDGVVEVTIGGDFRPAPGF